MKKLSILIILIFILASCNEKKRYERGYFPEVVTNFEDANSEFDDYNSTAPILYARYLFHFSSNRNSAGQDFDIVGENMFIEWDKIDETLDIGTDFSDDRFDYLMPMFDSINTPCNELGPYALGFRQDVSYYEVLWTDLIMYANDCGGNYDIKFIYSKLHNTTDTVMTEISMVQNIDFLNTDANELYPTFYGKDFFYHDEWGMDAGKIEKILYCSDTEGSFNIYEVNLPSGSTLINVLGSNNSFESRKLNLNASTDDKCPFVNGKLLVFSSNRSGGYGGFDLYYSIFENDNWTEPINFGEKINSGYDEYRPITLHYDNFDNSLMIFSSNRPGGQGGFDLYYTGIPQIIK